MILNISHYVEKTSVLGPGMRFAIWVQGCNKNCQGCINPNGQKLNGGISIDVDELFKKIITQKNIQGVTITGGEPFLQAEALYVLIQKIKMQKKLDVMIYTGFYYEDLLKKHGKNFFKYIDILVDGEYVEKLNTNSMYRGSDNQRILFLSGKYKQFSEKIKKTKNRNIEFELNKNNELILIGIPPKNFDNVFFDKLTKGYF